MDRSGPLRPDTLFIRLLFRYNGIKIKSWDIILSVVSNQLAQKCKVDQRESAMVSNTRSILSEFSELINPEMKYANLNWIWLHQARCISDVKADTDHTSFLTGTLSLKEENEVVFIFNGVVIFAINCVVVVVVVLLDLISVLIFRCICWGFRTAVLNWSARVCFRIPTRFGISLLVLSISGFSLLCSVPVIGNFRLRIMYLIANWEM